MLSISGNVLGLIIAVGAIAFIASAVTFVMLLYKHFFLKERQRLQQTRADIADMAILFQTMRDVIRQQKTLAKEFNEDLDKKMAVVKDILSRSMQKNNQLADKQEALLLELTTARTEVDDMLRGMRKTVQAKPGSAIPQQVQEQSAPPPAPAVVKPIKAPRPAPPDTAVKPAPQTYEGAFVTWPDAAPDTPQMKTPAPREKQPTPMPKKSDNPGAAREAFRALLDMEPSPPSPAEPMHTPVSPIKATTNPSSGNNGQKNLTPTEKRVLAAYQTGMTVPEIAKELGIGKGEIRLILSLLRQKSK